MKLEECVVMILHPSNLELKIIDQAGIKLEHRVIIPSLTISPNLYVYVFLFVRGIFLKGVFSGCARFMQPFEQISDQLLFCSPC